MFCLVFLVYVFSLGSLFFSSILAENPVPTMVFIEFWILAFLLQPNAVVFFAAFKLSLTALFLLPP